MLLTGLLRSYNEETNMERCLACLLEFCDEVVISDGGSTDRTEEIARGFDGVTWLDYLGGSVSSAGHWNHTANQLNFALPHCHGEWVILQDVDQVYCERVRAHIREELVSTPCDAFVMYCIHFMGDERHYIERLGVGPSTVRLWKSRDGIEFRGEVHSSHLSYLPWERICTFRGARFHYGYMTPELEMGKAVERHRALPHDAAYNTLVNQQFPRVAVEIPWERCSADCKTCWMEERA